MIDVKAIARELVLKLESERDERGIYISPDEDELKCGFDGELDMVELVQFVVDRIKEK